MATPEPGRADSSAAEPKLLASETQAADSSAAEPKPLPSETDSSAAEPKPLLLASWNVAGWEATLKYVKSYYGSLGAFLDRHGFDILCLQEVKVTRARLADHNAALLGAHSLDGWESYWSCSQKGFNGCTTFVRKGLTRGADAAPLGQRELDAESRCESRRLVRPLHPRLT